MTFRTSPRRGYGSLLNYEPSVKSYLQNIGAVALYDGTLNGSNIANLGSAGSAIDGVPTAVTIDSNGMNFNGGGAGTSTIVIPNHVSWVDLPAYTFIEILQANTIGEGSSGRGWTVGSLSHTANLTATPTIVPTVARATVSATSSMTNPIPAYPSSVFIVFMGWDGTNITGHSARLGQTELVAGSNSNGSGAVTSHGANSLFLGNRNGADRTLDGYIRLFAIVPSVLDLATRTKIARISNIIV